MAQYMDKHYIELWYGICEVMAACLAPCYPISPPLATNVLSKIKRFTSTVFPGINITLSWTRGEVILLGAKTVKVNMLYRGAAVEM